MRRALLKKFALVLLAALFLNSLIFYGASKGYLILFAPHAFAPERQSSSRGPPSPPVFLQISTHFTATPGILPPSTRLKLASIRCSSQVEPGDFTSDLTNRLRALYAQ